MPTYPNSTVPINATGIPKVDVIIDTMITPRILQFRQLQVMNEPSTLLPDMVTWKQSYNNWNPTADVIVRKNGRQFVIPETIDHSMGRFQPGPYEDGDHYTCTYTFDYFGAHLLADFISQAIFTIDTAGVGSAGKWTPPTIPTVWHGTVADLTVALAMEKLITDLALWHGRLIYALTGNQLEEGGASDIQSLLETLKRNAEERAYKTLDNEAAKIGKHVAAPTSKYFEAVMGNRINIRNWRITGK